MSTATITAMTGPGPVRRRRLRQATGTAAAGCLITGLGTSTPAAATDEAAPPTRFNVPCTIDPSMLPQTADAAAAWMAGCYEIDQLPETADAIAAWLQ